MTPHDQLKRQWFTSGHSDLWNCNSTYRPVPYEMLPGLHDISDDFSWLDDLPHESFTCTLDSDDNKIENLDHIVSTVRSLGLELPSGFVRFMADVSLQAKVPTCTACFLEISESLIPVPGFDGSYVLRFMNDSQGCVMWYLLLNRSTTPRVVASNYFFEPDIFEALADEEVGIKYPDVIHQASICADSFLEFVYRFWIENAVWYSKHDKRPLSAREADYKNQITTKP